MRKGLLLTQRDTDIICHLSYGLATDENIYRTFFLKEGGNTKTRRRVMVKRLHKLEAEDYILSKVNPRVKGVIYMLQKKGGQYAADQSGREVSNVWSYCPKDADIYHDLMVSELARMAVYEMAGSQVYGITFFLLEHCLKTGKAKKGLCYPDFKIGLKTQVGERIYNVEIDCGTISRADFIAKMDSFDGIILLATNTKERMDLLRRYTVSLYHGKSIYINTFERIKREGFFKGKWFSFAANEWRLIHHGQ